MTRSTRRPARLDPSLLLDAVEQVGVKHAADDGSHRLELQQALSLPLTSRRPAATGWGHRQQSELPPSTRVATAARSKQQS